MRSFEGVVATPKQHDFKSDRSSSYARAWELQHGEVTDCIIEHHCKGRPVQHPYPTSTSVLAPSAPSLQQASSTAQLHS
jgi:hypothetical protein